MKKDSAENLKKRLDKILNEMPLEEWDFERFLKMIPTEKLEKSQKYTSKLAAKLTSKLLP